MSMYTKLIVTLILIVYAIEVESRVYKWIDASGQIHYSDRATEAAKEVNIDVPQTAPVSESESPSTIAPYTNLEILQPEANQTLNTDTGEIAISVLLEPELQPEHVIQFVVDDRLVPNPSASTQIVLKLEVGSHKIYIAIVDATSKQSLMKSKSVTFHVRKPSATTSDTEELAPQ